MKIRMFLCLEKIGDAQDFVNIVSRLTNKAYLQKNEYIVDAKSILGVCSLDLTRPVCFIYESGIPEDIEKDLLKYSVE